MNPSSTRSWVNGTPIINRVALGVSVTAVLAEGIWIIWRGRFVPELDYGNWIRQGWLFHALLNGTVSRSYHLRHYPVPDSLIVVLIGILSSIVSPGLAGQLVLSVTLILFVLGIVYLLTALDTPAASPALLVALSLVLGRWFFLGSIAYFLGLSLFAFFAGTLCRRWRTISATRLMFWFICLFFVHFAACVAALTIAFPILGLNRGRSGVSRLLVATVPVAGLTIAYVWGLRAEGQLAAGGNQLMSVYKPALWDVWSYRLIPADVLFTFAPFEALDSATPATHLGIEFLCVLNVLWCLNVLAILFISLVVALRHTMLRPIALASLACIAVMLVIGRQIGHGEIGNRLILPALWMGLVCFAAEWQRTRKSRLDMILVLSCSGIIALQSAFLIYAVRRLDAPTMSDYSLLSTARSEHDFCAEYARIFNETRALEAAGVARHPWLLPINPVRRSIFNLVVLDQPRFDSAVRVNDVSLIAAPVSQDCEY